MKRIYPEKFYFSPPKALVIKEIFHWHMDETVTEEQVQRVLEPVIEMIRKGGFEKDNIKKA